MDRGFKNGCNPFMNPPFVWNKKTGRFYSSGFHLFFLDLEWDYLGSLQTRRALLNGEFDLLAFGERAITLTLDSGVVNKDVGAIGLRDETITLGVIEPLDGTGDAFRHFITVPFLKFLLVCYVAMAFIRCNSGPKAINAGKLVAALSAAPETTPAGSLFFGASDVDPHLAITELVTIEFLDCRFRFALGAHFHKRKALRTACVSIFNESDRLDYTCLREQCAQLFLCGREGQVTDV
jgi:hypothetical protein